MKTTDFCGRRRLLAVATFGAVAVSGAVGEDAGWHWERRGWQPLPDGRGSVSGGAGWHWERRGWQPLPDGRGSVSGAAGWYWERRGWQLPDGRGSVSRADPPYFIIDLTERARPKGVIQSETRSINLHRGMVGFEALEDFKARAIYWTPDGAVELLPKLLPEHNSTYAYAINDSGTIAGLSEKVTIIQQGHIVIIVRDMEAAIWQNSQPTNLNDLVQGGDDLDLKMAVDINPAGQIVGEATVRDSNTPRGFLFDQGIVTDLGQLVRPRRLNGLGQVVGADIWERNALVWDKGTITNLHRNPPLGGVKSVAYGINDRGWIVGEAQWHISKPEEATLWDGDQIIRLVPEFNRPQGVAWAVNNRDQITGWYTNLDDLNDPWHGVLWENGTRLDLVTTVPPAEGWMFLYPFGINESGQIVGGAARNNELGHAFYMARIKLGDLNCDGAVDFGDINPFVLALSDPGEYERQQPYCTVRNGDINGDGKVDFGDINPFVELLSGGGD